MKVLFLNPIGTLGGAERALLDIIASIKQASREVEVSVVALEDGPLLTEARRLGAAGDCLPVSSALARLGDSGGIDPLRMALAATSLPPWLSRFSRLLAERRPDVIHTNGFKAHVLAALTPRRSPGVLLWHFHDFISERPIMQRLLPRLRHRARLAIAVSEAVATDVRRALQGLEVRTILNGVRTCDFQPEKVEPANLDRLARLPPAPPGTLRVGLVSTFASWKGHDLFLDAAKHIDDPRVRFFLVGGPVYSTRGSQRTPDELRRRIAALGLESRCGLIPFQQETAPIFVALDVLVHASTKPEPFGRTVAEGMSSGRAVLAADAGGVPEQIVDEVSGLLFPPGDVLALVSQLRRLLDSDELRRRLGAAAKERATSALDFRRLGPEALEAYRTILQAPTKPEASKA